MIQSISMSPRGGKRPNAGRKAKYDEPTTARTYRIPVSVDEAVQEQAEKQDKSTSELVTEILRRYLRRK